MNLYAATTLVLSICTALASLRLIQLHRTNERQRKVLKRMERTIEKLNARNGKLWYQIARAQGAHYDRQEPTRTGLTITKV